MTQYTRLPHLIAPVVNDSKKAANALKWVVNEMENRYSLFVGAGCKDFDGHNKVRPEAPIPHIVVIIDELARPDDGSPAMRWKTASAVWHRWPALPASTW